MHEARFLGRKMQEKYFAQMMCFSKYFILILPILNSMVLFVYIIYDVERFTFCLRTVLQRLACHGFNGKRHYPGRLGNRAAYLEALPKQTTALSQSRLSAVSAVSAIAQASSSDSAR